MKKITFLLTTLTLFAFSWFGSAQFTEDFESGVPGNFTETTDAGNISWGSCGGSLGGQTCPITGSTSASFYAGSYDGYQTSLETPSMDLSAGNYQLKFDHSQLDWFGDQNTLLVELSTDGGTTWNTVANYTTSIDPAVSEDISLDGIASLTATCIVKFTGTDNYGYSIILDNVSVEPAPSCGAPTALNTDTITTTTANVNWTDGPGIVTANTVTVIPAIAGSPFTVNAGVQTLALSGLTSNTQYTVEIANDCGANPSDSIVFSTVAGCGDNVVYCYSNGFQTIGEYTVDTPGDYINIVVNAGQTESGYDDFVIYEGIGIGGTELYRGNGDVSGAGTITSTTGSITVAVDADGSFNCGDQGYTNIDFDITCTAPPPACVAPTALTATNITTTGADLGWTENNTPAATNWDLYIVAAGSTAPDAATTPTVDDTSSNAYTWTGGTAGTSYDFYVRTDCGADNTNVSSWVGPMSFSTKPANDNCVNATVLTVGSVFADNELVTSNIGATASGETPTPSCGNFGAGQDVWYSVTVPASGNVTIETASNAGSSLTDTVMSAYTGSCGNLTEISCDDDGGTSLFSLISLIGRTPGETIYIRAFEYGNNTFDTFKISAYVPPSPTNDDCANAEALTVGTAFADNEVVGTNVSATASGETPTPSCGNFGAGQDVWYSVTVPASGNVTIETASNAGSSLTDTVMSAYTGSCGNLTEIACDDDGGTSLFSLISLIGRIPGETIYIRAFEYGNNTFDTFKISAYDSTCSGVATTWNGTAWDNGAPDATTPAIIDGTYNTSTNGDITACSLEVTANGDVTVTDGNFISIGNAIVNNGLFLVNKGGSVVQISDDATVTGDPLGFDVEVITTPMDDPRYTYFSSPTQTATMQVFNSWAQMNRNFGWDGTTQDWVATGATDTMVPGAGYIVRPAGGNGTTFVPAQAFTTDFDGAFNNGVITQPLYFTAGPATDDDDNALVGNPYPSAIGSASLMTANPAVDGLYFWAHTIGGNWSTEEYKVWNSTGSVNGAPATISTGQGFFVVANAAGTLTFNNALRVTSGNNTFLRPNADNLDKVWLNLLSNTNVRSQILLGFNGICTDGYDMQYDARRFNSGNTVSLSSNGIGTNTNNLAIQTRGLLTDTDTTIPLNVVTTDDAITSLTISIDHFENLADTNIYLIDNVANITHDLKMGAYTFNITQAGSLDGRFEVVFSRNALSTQDFNITNKDLILANVDATHIGVKMTSGDIITNFKAYDALGKLVINTKPNQSTFNVDTKINEGTILFINVTLENGQVLIKKFIKM